MVSEVSYLCSSSTSHEVLILVLVEDGLREVLRKFHQQRVDMVLILVVVEDGLRANAGVFYVSNEDVLILVVVEDGLRGWG